MSTIRVLTLVFSLAPLAAGAEDLVAIYGLAKDSDPQLRAAQAEYRATIQAKPQARAGLFPSVDASARESRNKEDFTRTFGGVTDSDSTDYDSTTYSLSVTQPLFRYANLARNRLANDTVQRAEAQLSAAEQSLVLRAAEGYFNVLSARAEVEFARSEKTATARQLEQAKKRFEVGMIAITDVHEAQAAYDAAVAQELAAENQLANAREALRELTGRYHTDLAGLTGRMPLVSPEPADMDKWTEVALEQNLQLRAARFSAQEARDNVDVNRAGYYPNVDVVASRDHFDSGGGTFGSRESDTDTIALQLSANLYQGGLTNARVREAEHLYTQSREQVEVQRRAALRQTRDAYRGVNTGISRVTALKQAIVSAESALEATEAGFEVGTRTIVDVLLAQRNLFRARRDYAQARYEYIVNTLRLKQAAGTLEPGDLQRINTWLEQ
ncbi:MAG: TolC family outer membrane protein [Gammaproteobacteria bacterium]|nr:TolC family outer membrane protein [Gammaproteobacteria bacterium]NIR28891.1 TolC family outer membrane protein [Gammaproteobacteria bacterium]NIR97286.1 TolC family outer membrane protein [Gammaproteobacteria bacterium]NIT62987.1 TolC family outer membrane protein [Gammaproteobacteria bacterium]NIV19945.1 TolC family outer membrane protein [Gammaproteobacteria bacterium]